MKMGSISVGRKVLIGLLMSGAALFPAVASAGEVTLKSPDGTVNLVGEFVEFKDNTYVIRTALGDLSISASRVSCQGADCPTFETATADIAFAGSDTVGLGVMPLLLSGYAAFLGAEATPTETGVEGQILATLVGDEGFGDEIGKFLVTSTVSGDAFKALLDKSATFGMTSRRIRPAEAKELKAAGAGNMVSPAQEHIIAVDGLMVIVHPENPIESLTMEQVRDIYAGIIVNWSELGGPDLPIQVLDRQEDSGTRAVFQGVLFGENVAPPLTTAIIEEDNAVTAATVNDNPGAIGYVGYAFQRGAKALNLVNECGITVVADAFSTKTEEYPLERLLYLYTRADNLPPAAIDFLDFVKSTNADEVIARSGFVDLGIARQLQTLEGPRGQSLLAPNADAFESGVMREMLAQMVDYDRLSSTFRFSPGSSKLDERGVLDMERLANYLATMPPATKVLFVGFTDDVGEFSSNRRLSENRAAQIMQEMQALGGDRLANVEMASMGFGEIAPSACNTTEKGQEINRRVEVWIQDGTQ
jgi:phosphate transport system substrate-binding protein